MDVSFHHCRPGLAMTIDELAEAKVLILDLLGMGMSPEDLISAGISKECLVPCLRELKFRLPTNVDLSDVVFYDPPMDEATSTVSNHSLSTPQRPPPGSMDTGNGQGSLQEGAGNSSWYKDRGAAMEDQEKAKDDDDSDLFDPGAIVSPEEQAASLLERLLPMVKGDREEPSSIAKPPNMRSRRKPSAQVGEMEQEPTDVPSLPLKAQKKLARNTQSTRAATMAKQGEGTS
ncbi:hypothetical protein FRC14_002904 [Serendipita sp. 396]|nr:hypothetical protein FRC14_002904 [Serendipita sp. 396]KAG8784588.1 hypothetical protein FRC15_002994 [Serendipita sp. 397]KAG8803618.1 hypothetical protein FRC16_004170 [Serendipita sp. 398]KAG8820254.1 hypothetical protein FRC19_009020 [Serendipita sp. 401]KAG8874873.1 hypothetical protein FRC20_004987 [Serendipita sp. 405]KAG9056694.1 hypothetical protein FS842_009861 [Serendipita sp. 407]